MSDARFVRAVLFTTLALSFACGLPLSVKSPPSAVPVLSTAQASAPPSAVASTELGATPEPSASPAAAVTHLMLPANGVPSGTLVYDVTSQDTAPEKRAPYGDSYGINRFERPFLQDMTYVPDLDIASFSVSKDSTWWYVSIALVGNDPNNKLGINYGVELDTNHDGFGDYLIWAQAPYATAWDSAPVQIFQDTNHDTGGLSAEKSDAPMAKTTDGYDTLIFHGGVGDADPDVAWVRIISGVTATVQFAFKQSWSGSVFMLGVISDAGLKDPKKMDYVDRFTLAQAGSPLRDNSNYPLKALFAVDNVCRAAFGFKATGDEPQLCPSLAPPATKRAKPTGEPPSPTPIIIY